MMIPAVAAIDIDILSSLHVNAHADSEYRVLMHDVHIVCLHHRHCAVPLDNIMHNYCYAHCAVSLDSIMHDILCIHYTQSNRMLQRCVILRVVTVSTVHPRGTRRRRSLERGTATTARSLLLKESKRRISTYRIL